MKRLLLFIFISFVNFCLYGINTNCVDSVLSIDDHNSIELVKKNKNIKTEEKSNLSVNYLFFGDGDILDEDFEKTTGWNFSNGATGNKWAIGTAVNNGGTKSLYISKDDGVSYEYDTKVATVVHAYKGISIPATSDEISISFDWKCLGEGVKPQKDFFNVWLVSDSFVPVLGSKITELKDDRILLGSFNNNDIAFKNDFIGLDSNSLKGKKMKIVFEWINDTTDGWQPPAAIDNVKISNVKCTKPSNVIFEDIKPDSALMKWDASKSTNAEYDIYYSKDITPPTTTTVPVKSGVKITSSLLDKLDSNTIYYVWIRSVCGTDKGFWSKVYKFKTACGIFNIPFKDGFNWDSPKLECWTIIDGNKDKDFWEINTYAYKAFEGNQAMQFSKSDPTNTIENDDWLISPTIKMNGTYRLKYHYNTSGSGTNEFEVLLSKDGKEIKDFKQILVAKKNYTNDQYIEKAVILNKIVGDINIAWHANGKGSSDIYIDNVIIEKVENCPEPMELDVEDIKKDGVTIFWQDDFGGKKWEYFVQEEGEGAPTGSGTSTNQKKATITKENNGDTLKPNTAYEYYVRVDCGDGKHSIWSGPKIFRTACEVFTIPFSEGFNSNSNSAYCWTIIDVNNDGATWKTNLSLWDSFEGDRMMFFNKEDPSNTIEHDDWLISPTIKMNGTYRLKYHYKVSDKDSNEFEVLLSKDGKEIKNFKKTLVAKKSYNNNTYIEKVIILNNIVGDVNIAWHINGKGNSQIYIDNVIIEEVEGCPEPFDLEIKDVMSKKVTILWSNEFDAKNWEYYVQPKGKGKPTKSGFITSKTENIATIDNEVGVVLLPNTEYEFYVRTVCGGSENSIWAGPFVFKTQCEVYDPPFWEGFNKDSKSISCWNIINENQDVETWKNVENFFFYGTMTMLSYEGNAAMNFKKDDYTNTVQNDEWLISPTIKMNGTYRLKYHYKVLGPGTNEFEVLLSKEGEETKSFKQTLVAKKTYKNNEYIEKIVILNNIVGDVNIAWHANGKGSSDIYIDNIIIEEIEGCAEPMDLDVKDILHNKITILWVDESGSKSWEYFVQLRGKGEPTKSGTITSNRENEISLDNKTDEELLPNTEYEFYVRTVCDDGKNSIWSGPFVFTTGCSVYDLPFWEGFNSYSETINCWTIYDENKDLKTWRTNAYESFEGTGAASCGIYDNSNVLINDDWLISPTVKTNGGMYRIKYHYKTAYDKEVKFEILMSKKGTDIKNFTEDVQKEQLYSKVNNYVEKIVFVDNLSGDINFAWHVTTTGSSYIFLDNVFIEKVKGCPEPYYVNITEQTDDAISIEWEQYGSGDKWEVIAVPYGKEIPDEKDLKPTPITKVPKATITGLDSGKAYSFYVRVICKDGTPSDWSTGKAASTKVKENDDCFGAYNIPVNKEGEGCEVFTSGTLLGSTLSVTTKEKCISGRKPVADVWFEFTAISETHVISFLDEMSISNDLVNYSVALYADDCTTPSDPIECYPVDVWKKSKKINNFEIGKKYYLRIYSTNKKDDIFFKLCIVTPSFYVSPSGEDYTVKELVKDVLIGSNCDLISNIKYQVGNNSKINTLGYFNKQKSDFPYEEGIVLTTHDIKYTSGPHIYDFNADKAKIPVWSGDPDLNNVINQVGGDFNSNKSVSVLEFDFIPIKDSIKFEYMFACESYRSSCIYACKEGGALFAAWLTDLSTGDGRNLALVPGTTKPISLSTIRDSKKTGSECKSVNPEFFGECYSNKIRKYDPLKAAVDYAGITIPMTSEKVAVKVLNKYRIKIAIADFCPSTSHVSAVFFNGNSFDLGKLDLGDDMLVATNNALCEGSEAVIYSGLDNDQANIKWYKDGVLMPEETNSKLTVREFGDYKVVGKYGELNCDIEGSIKIEIYPKVEEVISNPEDIHYCTNSLTAKETIDITTNEKIILKNLKAEDYKFFYYLTKEDSEKDKNAIEKPTEFEIPKDKQSKDIYVRIVNTVTTCIGFQKFNLIPQRAEVPISPGDQQLCKSYIFKELPKGQHYYPEAKAQGKEYIAGNVIDKPGNYKIYICSIVGDCYEEVSFNLEILPFVKAKVFKDETLKCENYVLQDLPAGNRYFTEPEGQGEELLSGDVIRFDKIIYVYAKSAQGPNYCIDQSSFTITFEDCDIPKGISPNGDGLNDVLDLEVHGVTSITIYNRYGGEVYSHGKGYTNQWYGQDNNGNQLPDGTYYYAIEARGKTKTGWIQINR